MSDAPHIVAANKQDVEGCLTPEIIRIMMKIPSSIPDSSSSGYRSREC